MLTEEDELSVWRIRPPLSGPEIHMASEASALIKASPNAGRGIRSADGGRAIDGEDGVWQVVDIFQDDLRRRGIELDPPASLDGSDRWGQAIRDTYGASSY